MHNSTHHGARARVWCARPLHSPSARPSDDCDAWAKLLLMHAQAHMPGPRAGSDSISVLFTGRHPARRFSAVQRTAGVLGSSARRIDAAKGPIARYARTRHLSGGWATRSCGCAATPGGGRSPGTFCAHAADVTAPRPPLQSDSYLISMPTIALAGCLLRLPAHPLVAAPVRGTSSGGAVSIIPSLSGVARAGRSWFRRSARPARAAEA